MVNNTFENLVFNQTDLHCVFHVVDLTLWDNKAFVVVDSNFQTMLKKSNILPLLMGLRCYRWLPPLLQAAAVLTYAVTRVGRQYPLPRFFYLVWFYSLVHSSVY